MDLDPALVLAMWTAGTAGVSAVVVGWGIVGSGYVRLAAAVVVLFGAAAAGSGAGGAAWIATGAAAAALVLGGARVLAISLLSIAGLFLVVAASDGSPLGLVVTGGLFLGAITSEMMLGHWYLVDPRLPRWALHTLAVGAAAALIADVVYLTAEGVFDWGAGDEVLGWAFVALALLSAALVTAVSLSLREPSYTGVMAATGLSYLAVLTAFGVVVLGRLLAF